MKDSNQGMGTTSHAYGIDTHTLIMRLKEFGVERQVSCFLYLYHARARNNMLPVTMVILRGWDHGSPARL